MNRKTEMGGDNPVVKPWTKRSCEAGALAHRQANDMGCGTNPNPKNAACYRQNESKYQEMIKHCPKK